MSECRRVAEQLSGLAVQTELHTGFMRLGFELTPIEFKELWSFVDEDGLSLAIFMLFLSLLFLSGTHL